MGREAHYITALSTCTRFPGSHVRFYNMSAYANFGLLFFCVVIVDFSMSSQVRKEPNAMDIINQVNQGRKQDGGMFLRELDVVHIPPAKTAAGHDELSAAVRRGSGRLWPSGVIPYVMAQDIRERPFHVAAIERAMRDWERDTCLKFVEKKNIAVRTRGTYMRIMYGNGCYATVGRLWYGPSYLSLGRGCHFSSVAAHELGHVIGFSHEHNRPDRDSYIEILWENIKTYNLSPYRPVSSRYFENYGVPYDYESIMHYQSYEFSKNGEPTMRVRDPKIKTKFGNTKPTALDIQQANFMYNCPVYPRYPDNFTIQTTPDDNKICITLNQTHDPDWVTRYLCYKPTIKKMNITWSQDGPIRGLECINTKMPLERASSYWRQTYLCVPRDELYRFYWLINGPMRSEACLKIRDNKKGGYYLCAWKKRKDVDGAWSSWSPWQQCDRKCGGGLQARTRQCNNPKPANGGKMCAGASYNTRSCNQQNCPEWPQWPYDFRFLQQGFAPARFKCVKVYQGTNYRYGWRRFLFCWAKWKRPLAFKWSDVGPVKRMRCTRIREQNYLCAGGDYPYKFTWSSSGIRGFRCLPWGPNNNMCAREFPEPTKAPSSGCYMSWSSFQVGRIHYCYIRVFRSVTWEEARRECRDMNAELVSIGSQAEWEFVLRKLQGGQSVWLGLNDRQWEGQWVWSDRTPLTFTDWSRSEPSPEDRRENCAMSNVYTSKWNDYPCTSKFKFICKTTGLVEV